MDLIYIILISIAVVSFIVGFIIDVIQKRQSNTSDVNNNQLLLDVEQNSNSLNISSAVIPNEINNNVINTLHNNSQGIVNTATRLQVSVDNNVNSANDNSSEPVIISSVVLESYDDEIL